MTSAAATAAIRQAIACTHCGGTDHDSAAHQRVSAAISMAQRELAGGHAIRARLWLGVAEQLARKLEEQSE